MAPQRLEMIESAPGNGMGSEASDPQDVVITELRNSQAGGDRRIARRGTAMAERLRFRGEATRRAGLAGPALVDDGLRLPLSKS
jgi:hypothetical protein